MTGSGKSAGVFTTDAALVVRSWDAWVAAATGLDESEAIGRPLAELFPDIASRGLLERLRAVVTTGAVSVLAPAFHHYLLPCPPRAPSAHFARMQQLVTIAPLRSGDAIVGVVASIEDVTARLDRERALAGDLRSPDDAVRLAAARAIAGGDDHGGPLADGLADVLGHALGDDSWQVRRAAAEGLARGDSVSVDALVATLRERHRDPAALNAALTALARSGADVAPRLVALLDSPDADIRTYVALALGLLADRRGVRPLIATLDDADANVRFHAIEALGRIGAREAAAPLAAVAESRDFAVAFPALDALALIGEPSVAPRLVPLLDDDLLQPAAADALGRIGSEEVVAPLAALLRQPGPSTGAGAAALAALHDRLEAQHREGDVVAGLARSAMPADGARHLLAAMAAADEPSLAAIARVVSWLDAPGVDDALAALLDRPTLRRLAGDLLAQRGARAVGPLVRALGGDDFETRKVAAAALGRIGATDAVGALVAALDDEPEITVVVAGALGSIGSGQAFEPLIAHLDYPQAAVRQALVSALNSLGHPEMGARVRTLLADPSPAVRESAARIAGYFGYADCSDALLSLCDDADDGVRRAAVEQLPHLEDPRARGALREALARGTPGVRAAAARAIAHLTATDALPLVREATQDADPWVRYYAARSAGRLALREATPLLAELARRDPAPPVRIAAIDALGEIGSDDGVAALAPLVDDRDEAVAQQALAALGGARSDVAAAPLLAALAGSDLDQQRVALVALGRRHADAAAIDAIASLARRSADEECRRLAVAALGTIATEPSMDALVALADEPRLAAAVVATLAAQGETQLAWIGRGLHHPDVGARCVIVEALGRMRHRGAASLLAGALHDRAPVVRLAAIHALARKDLRDMAPGLAALAADDQDAAVRRAAQRALTR